ncbi:MAG: response regulator [Thermoleophilaceae bacterium]
MIRVFLVDDHPALRAGLHTVFRGEPGMVPVGAAAGASEAIEGVDRASPDVVLVDYHLPEEDGLSVCHRITSAQTPARVLIYSAYASAALAIPAIVAGASGVAAKSAPADELLDAVRVIARGDTVLPPISPHHLQESVGRLDPERELPVFGMLMERVPAAEIAGVLGVEPDEVAERVRSMLVKLRVPVTSD